MIASDTSLEVDAIFDEIDASLSLLEPAPLSGQHDQPARRRNAHRDPAIKRISVLLPVHNARWIVADVIERMLQAPMPLDMEIVAVDDGSTDGTAEFLEQLAQHEPRLQIAKHETHQGSGAAIRTALHCMTGDVVIIQDLDAEFDPRAYRQLLEPILRGEADAVFGSRFLGTSRRVMPFGKSLAARWLTGVCNLINNLNLTDVEGPCKAIRADVLKPLQLRSKTASLHSELATRLAQSGARIEEIAIRAANGHPSPSRGLWGKLASIGSMLRCRLIDPCFTSHSGQFILSSVARANRYNAWLLEQCAPFLGPRLLEAGAGIGNLSTRLTERERLVLVDYEATYVSRLKTRFQSRFNIRVLQADLTNPQDARAWKQENLDTIFCSNVLEHLEPDVQVLRTFHESLQPEGHCIIIVPAEQSLFMPLDSELGHFRRYSQPELRDKMQQAGFDVVFASQFCKIGSLAWWWNGRVLNRRHLSPRQMVWFDRLWPIARHLDRILPVPGMSLMMVGRRPRD